MCSFLASLSSFSNTALRGTIHPKSRVTYSTTTVCLFFTNESRAISTRLNFHGRVSASRIPRQPYPASPKAAMSSQRVPIEPQRVDAPLTKSATFLVLSATDKPDSIKTIRSVIAGLDDLAKNVSIRDLNAQFACTVGIGSDIWDRLTGLPRPAELHPFREIKGNKHTAVSTPGDLLRRNDSPLVEPMDVVLAPTWCE